MDLRRLGLLALLAVIIYAVIKDPAGGAHAARAIGGFFGQAAAAFSQFMNSI
jgi:hypothetical protein